jgi:hypothetical protein
MNLTTTSITGATKRALVEILQQLK